MEEINSKNSTKDLSIVNIVDYLNNHLDQKVLKIADFWDADNFAIGLLLSNILIYISTWDFRSLDLKEMKYYVEFELINLETLETVKTLKSIPKISKEQLLLEIKYLAK
jgi:hypothetical protein